MSDVPNFPDVLHLTASQRRLVGFLEEHLAQEPPQVDENAPHQLQERQAATWAGWDRGREALRWLIAMQLLGQIEQVIDIRKEDRQ